MRQRVRLTDELKRVRPDLADATGAIIAGRVRVNGSVIANPDSRVARGVSIVVVDEQELRGAEKLRAALDAFGVVVQDKTCVDIGAAAGGFTKELVDRGARRVYSIDAGHGQLLGSLRQDARVVNLEATNVADLDRGLVPDPVDLATIDVSYLSLSDAVGQIEVLNFSPSAELIGLVKPMFELRLANAPTDSDALARAMQSAERGAAAAGWTVAGRLESDVGGAKGAIEGFVYARRPVTT
jgi:23S rRNA (cytidine1920-2'-O)/16S rRNA (cytidine1409-2'-O)-methyltransferase